MQSKRVVHMWFSHYPSSIPEPVLQFRYTNFITEGAMNDFGAGFRNAFEINFVSEPVWNR